MAVYHALQHGIHCVDAAHVRDKLASIYILQQGQEVAIIDTGSHHSLGNVQTTLAQLGIHPSQVKYVIPTHIHLDHAGGASTMMGLFEQARLIIHPRGARHMIDPSRLIEGSMSVYGKSKFLQLYGQIRPIDENRIDIAEDLDCFHLEAREILFIDTPGHARHHFCIYDDQSQGIFTGDTFGLAYPPVKHHPYGLVPTSSPVQFDPEAMISSIDRLLTYQPERMYLTHFGAIDKPAERSVGLKYWVAEYLKLCERLDPQSAESERQLEIEMRDMIFSKLLDDPSLSRDELAYLLNSDIKLNSQGLAIWWRSVQND